MVDDESEALEKKRTPITNYEVIRLGHQCALVECTTKTGTFDISSYHLIILIILGFTHQIRCHLGFGLNTPILGDHKYSHFLDFKPQVGSLHVWRIPLHSFFVAPSSEFAARTGHSISEIEGCSNASARQRGIDLNKWLVSSHVLFRSWSRSLKMARIYSSSACCRNISSTWWKNWSYL